MQDRSRGITSQHIHTLALISTLGFGLALSACSSGSGNSGPVRTVSLGEFASAEQRHARANARTSEPAEDDRIEDESAQSLTPAVVLEAAPPDESASRSPRTDRAGKKIIVDSLVGQVNGRPIFANAFFAPIEDQLIALRRRVSEREFTAQAMPIITEHLRQIVLNELFLAEAEAQLSPQEQQGIIAWMRQMRSMTISESGGTRTATQRRLADQEGVSLDDYVAARRDMVLIQQLRRDKIEPRVIVSWRDVQREYERRFSEFNPPATLKLTRIRLSTRNDAEQIEQVKQRLASGESFAAIARDLGQREGEQWQEFQMGPNGIADVALAEPIKQRIMHLDVGQTSEPFEQGTSTWWLHIADIEQPQGRDLYDPQVQRTIKTSLENRRFNEEMNRYIGTLFEQGIYDELDAMLYRLIEIASVRYGR